MRMIIKTFMQKCPEKLAHLSNVVDKVYLSDDTLHLQGCSTAYGMTLVGMTVGKGTSIFVSCKFDRTVEGSSYPVPFFNTSATRGLISMAAIGA
jgi:hypothetical protein